MIISKVEIKKFRGFDTVNLELGSQLTVIAGQNGTQKTTVLGILTQPFTISDKKHPMISEKPLTGGSFKSGFKDKFKLSENFDIAKSHEWTLHLTDGREPFTVESITRNKGKAKDIRFWKKGNRSAGSGYIQMPVIYLSLQRLLPIGEDPKLKASQNVSLTPAELLFFQKAHKSILMSNDNIQDSNFLESPSKKTLGINTDYYDWKQNSAGQDNIGKILLAIISFKRLKEKYKHHYKGGILAIDELDATIYPGSQIQLFNALRTYASKYDIQIFFTTHSLTLLERAGELQEENKKHTATKDQVRVLFLEKKNSNVKILQDVPYNVIVHKLNVTISESKSLKLLSFSEDKEGEIFCKAILKGKANNLKFFDGAFSCNLLVDLGFGKVPSFTSPFSLAFLDGDVRGNKTILKKVESLDNYLILPGTNSPERVLAHFLFNLDDNSDIWEKIKADGTYTKQVCFKNVDFDELMKDRVVAKKWFKTHIKYWGNNGYKVIDAWAAENEEEVKQFIDKFIETYNTFADSLNMDKI
ncbi:AAA family ATPase [Chitinophaga sp. Cy-1792]|uniref:AAA family ATPase n=1 Tax=Chitinophaga sp. Cy-1792 TaxID=2608339 RepID=UPI00141DF1E8|nr:AAA family ATPase [Chitinophaga sp. Cy-1792]NIG55030.1 ATP-binding protein [Chitinophaga sp. Cy-1792]